jgi:hypothetical protein
VNGENSKRYGKHRSLRSFEKHFQDGPADPSATLGMTKGRAMLSLKFVVGEENRRSPFDYAQGRLSTTLRSGRDDNSYLGRVRVPRKNCHPEKSHEPS